MKKSELKDLIREVLHEELLKESTKGSIDEKAFIASATRAVGDTLGGGKFESTDGKVLEEIPTDFNKLKMTRFSAYDGMEYSFILASGLPEDAKLSNDLKSKMQKLADFWEKQNSEHRDYTVECDFKQAKNAGGGKNIFCKIKLVPNSGYTLNYR